MAKKFFTHAVWMFLLALASPRAGEAVARFDTAEITLRSTASFNANSGTQNPFTTVDLTARVTAPSGRVYTVDGFFDGDGAGGATGNVFKLRVSADEIGTWRWTTTSNTAGLNALSGTFSCSGTLAGAFGKGPVVKNPARPRTFKYQYGEPVYLIGKFLDTAASAPIQYSHALLSEKLTEANRQAMLSRHVGMKLNKMNVYLANVGDYGGLSTTPWVGTAGSSDKQRFDLARWRMFDQWVVRLRDAGLAAHLWFFADDSGFGNLSEADRRLLIEYAMARHSAYVNTMFILALEWQESLTAAEVGADMGYLHSKNPWARLASVHGVTGDFSFPSAAWADYMDTQAGNEVGYAAVHAHGLRHRGLSAMPLIQEEFGLGAEDTAHRQKAWAAFTAGAAGSGTGSFLAHLSRFASEVDFERMDPDDSLAPSGNAYVLAEKGSAYVAYLYNGGTVRLDLRNVTGTFAARWFDPRTGTWRDAGSVAGGQERSFTAPAAGDWTLSLKLASSPPVQRSEVAAALVEAMHGPAYVPPAATGLFSDVPLSHGAVREIELIYRDQITSGCNLSPLRYCPDRLLSRAEMAVLILRAQYGPSWAPPQATGTVFADVPATQWAAAWIEHFYADGITAGCGTNPRRYCPNGLVTAMELDAFLGVAF